jgi:hypothetical protein
VIPFFTKGLFSEYYKNVKSLCSLETKSTEQALDSLRQIMSLNTDLIKQNANFWQRKENEITSGTI